MQSILTQKAGILRNVTLSFYPEKKILDAKHQKHVDPCRSPSVILISHIPITIRTCLS